MNAEEIIRPNGRLYRPRKVEAVVYGDQDWGDEDIGVVVFGTHDIERARPLADSLCQSEYGLSATDPELVWWRDAFQDGRRAWVQDEVRGRAGVKFIAIELDEVTD